VLAAIITPGVRRSMPHAPLFAITAPVAGSLKSKLVDTASYIWSGHPSGEGKALPQASVVQQDQGRGAYCLSIRVPRRSAGHRSR